MEKQGYLKISSEWCQTKAANFATSKSLVVRNRPLNTLGLRIYCALIKKLLKHFNISCITDTICLLYGKMSRKVSFVSSNWTRQMEWVGHMCTEAVWVWPSTGRVPAQISVSQNKGRLHLFTLETAAECVHALSELYQGLSRGESML